MIPLRWSQRAAYFRVHERPGGPIIRVPVTLAQHNDLIRGEAVTRAFARLYGKRPYWPSQQQLVLSDRWHRARSIADEWAWRTVRSQHGAITFQNATSGSPLDFSTTNTFAFDPTNADFLWVMAANDRTGTPTTIDSITWNANALTLQTAIGGVNRQGRMGHLVGTLNGSQNVVVTNSDINTKPMALAGSYAGVDQTTPMRDQGGGVFVQTFITNSNNPQWTVVSASGDVVCAAAIVGVAGATWTPGTDTNERVDRDFSGVGSGTLLDEASTGSSVFIDATSSGSGVQRGYAFSLIPAATGSATGELSNPIFRPRLRSY